MKICCVCEACTVGSIRFMTCRHGLIVIISNTNRTFNFNTLLYEAMAGFHKREEAVS